MAKVPNIIFFTALLLVASNITSWPFAIRFNYAPINYFCFTFFLSVLSTSAIVSALKIKKRLLKYIALICSVIFAVPCLLICLVAIVMAVQIIHDGKDTSYDFLRQATNQTGTYRLYRTDCGATCDFGLQLRKEIDTPFGIKFVKPVWSGYHAYDAELITTDNTITIVENGYVLGEIQ